MGKPTPYTLLETEELKDLVNKGDEGAWDELANRVFAATCEGRTLLLDVEVESPTDRRFTMRT